MAEERSRWPWRVKLGIAFVLAIVANAILFLREAQRRERKALSSLKKLERRANPWILKWAGASPLGLASLEHRGRVSGAQYTTPLAAARLPGGFVFGMPYGERSDWARNLLAAGEGIVTFDGVRYRVGHPRVISAAKALPRLPLGFRVFSRLLDLQAFMEVDVVRLQHESPRGRLLNAADVREA